MKIRILILCWLFKIQFYIACFIPRRLPARARQLWPLQSPHVHDYQADGCNNNIIPTESRHHRKEGDTGMMNRVVLRGVLERRRWVDGLARLSTSGSVHVSDGTHADDIVLVSCVALERLPVVMPEVPAWERDYKAWQETWNARRFKELPSAFTTSDVKMKDDGKSSGRASWQPAPLKTSADEKNDRKSLQRKLDHRLFLLVKTGGVWDFVHLPIGDDDVSSRSVAEKALESLMGEKEGEAEGRYYFVGNAPAAHTVSQGRTSFYHRCQLIQLESFHSVQMNGFEDFAWVSPDEFGEYLDQDVAKVLQQMEGY